MKRISSPLHAVVQGIGGVQVSIITWLPPTGKRLPLRRATTHQSWLSRSIETCQREERSGEGRNNNARRREGEDQEKERVREERGGAETETEEKKEEEFS